MVKITLLAVGKPKRSWVREGIQEYAVRLPHYCQFAMQELRDSDPKSEGREILKRVDGTMLVALAIGGKPMSSEQLAAWVQKQNRPITFAIGSENGLSPEVLAKAELQLSLSAMTFPHELCRIFLLEQLYRAFALLREHPYPK